MTLRRVEGIDSAFLAAETAEWHFHVSAVQIIDTTNAPSFGFAAYRQVLEQRIHLIPQFRWRVIEPPLRLGWSYFADDPEFDLDAHLHQVTCSAPGDRETLGALIGELISRKIDRKRPLWEVWFIDGLEDQRVAVLTKVHHAIIDGQSGADVAAALYDISAEPPEPPQAPPFEPEPLPSQLELSARNLVRSWRVPLRVAQLGQEMVSKGLASLPLTFSEHPPAMPFQAPRTMFNGQLTAQRGFASASLSLGAVKQVKDAAGVKFNDVVLAVCSAALRGYLAEHSELPDKSLIAQVPVSTRTDASNGDIGTQVGSMFVSLSSDLEDPLERLQAIHESSVAGKGLRGAFAEHHTLVLSDALPPALFSVAARMWSAAHLDALAPPIYNVIISNVAGPPMDFYVAGARIEKMYPLGPLLYGGGLNITVFSNGDTLDVGLITCSDLVPNPWPLADGFQPALDELIAAVARRQRKRKVPNR